MHSFEGLFKNWLSPLKSSSRSPDLRPLGHHPSAHPTGATPTRLHERGFGCTELNATDTAIYQVSGSTFNVTCNWTWYDNQQLFVTYTIDFPTCMNECVAWNAGTNSGKCVGVKWTYGFFGPLGPSGGSFCAFFWVISGSGVASGNPDAGGSDSGVLQLPDPYIPVPHHIECLLTCVRAP
jgi:hypothetical protein